MKIKVDNDLVQIELNLKDKKCDCEHILDCALQSKRTYYHEFMNFCKEQWEELFKYLSSQDGEFVVDWSIESPYFIGVEVNWALNRFAVKHGKVLDWSIPESIKDWLDSEVKENEN